MSVCVVQEERRGIPDVPMVVSTKYMAFKLASKHLVKAGFPRRSSEFNFDHYRAFWDHVKEIDIREEATVDEEYTVRIWCELEVLHAI